MALAIGCGEGEPPLDELPLRDALQVAPAVVAGLPVEVRARLAARLEAARTSDLTSEGLGDQTSAPEKMVGALDRSRVERNADPLLAGMVADGLASPLADPLVGAPGAALTPTALPPVEGEPAGETAPLEARALDGAAGATLRALLTASGARHLSRVTGWPIGAVAIDGTVYMNASWLVALAPVDAASGALDESSDGGSVDGGPDGATTAQNGSSGLASIQGAEASAPSPLDGGARSEFDSGTSSEDAAAERAPSTKPVQIAAAAGGEAADGVVVIIIGGPQPPPTTAPTAGDACGASADACDSTDTSSCDGTDDGSDDSCSGSTDDGSDDSCSTPPDDGGGCEVAHHGAHRTRYGTLLWMLAPLGFLLGRRP